MAMMPNSLLLMRASLHLQSMRAFALSVADANQVLNHTRDEDYATIVRNIDYFLNRKETLPLKATQAEYLWIQLIMLMLARAARAEIVVYDSAFFKRAQQVEARWRLRPGY